MEKHCFICGDDEAEGAILVRAPCASHWVCVEDVANFFKHAAENERLFPPTCCDVEFLVKDHENYLSYQLKVNYEAKAAEYRVPAKYRIYCASPSCRKFFKSSMDVAVAVPKVFHVVCEDAECKTVTCVSCRKAVKDAKSHVCEMDEDDIKFKLFMSEKGYQECPACSAVVELIDACNHICCTCGHNFCYVCGKAYQGPHGCPQYGPARYDKDGYNQEGYHRVTGLNRNGRTHRQEVDRAHGQFGDDDGLMFQGQMTDWDMVRAWEFDMRETMNRLHGLGGGAWDNHRNDVAHLQWMNMVNGPPDDESSDDGDGEAEDNEDDGDDEAETEGEGERDDESEDDPEDEGEDDLDFNDNNNRNANRNANHPGPLTSFFEDSDSDTDDEFEREEPYSDTDSEPDTRVDAATQTSPERTVEQAVPAAVANAPAAELDGGVEVLRRSWSLPDIARLARAEQEAREREVERPDWFPPVGGWPDDEEL